MSLFIKRYSTKRLYNRRADASQYWSNKSMSSAFNTDDEARFIGGLAVERSLSFSDSCFLLPLAFQQVLSGVVPSAALPAGGL